MSIKTLADTQSRGVPSPLPISVLSVSDSHDPFLTQQSSAALSSLLHQHWCCLSSHQEKAILVKFFFSFLFFL